jgi:5-methylcytosine-specific restriction protein B
MSKIYPITKESILKAIESVDSNPVLRNGRESIEYDLVYKGKRYPPVLVLSEANKELGGEALTINDFGNSTKRAFSILENFNFIVQKKSLEFNKQIIFDIISLCETIVKGKEEGRIAQSTYSEIFKPHLNEFRRKHGETPNLFLQNLLENFYNANLKGVDEKIEFKSFGFWGRVIYNYVWSCIYYDSNTDAIPASYSPQLFILVNKYGIKFGFCYGHYIANDDILVSSVRNDHNIFLLLKECLEIDPDLCFFNKPETEVTARPEKLFGKDEQIQIKSDKDILENWSNSSLLIKEFPKDEIPDNVYELVENTLGNLKNFYLSLLPIVGPPEIDNKLAVSAEIFKCEKLIVDFKKCGLFVHDSMVIRFVGALISKPFVILTGLSGSGKTKLAQAFAMWISEKDDQYCIVPVGADWTSREPLLGFPNALKENEYVRPENGVLDLIINANKNANKPYFLILDEMNLSHVERYFADFLSVMESKTELALHTSENSLANIPGKIGFPKNLFILGTVNVDETTYMFSPKVLDRASVLEFRITALEMENYLNSKSILNLKNLKGEGKGMAQNFVEIVKDSTLKNIESDELTDTMVMFFNELKKLGAEFGYRSASEINRFAAAVNWLEPSWSMTDIIDAAIMQKLLPKVHGSKKRLEPVLRKLGELCLTDPRTLDEILKTEDENLFAIKGKFPISLEKIIRMYKNLMHNGFTSYAEA